MRTVKVTKEVDVVVPDAESCQVTLYRADEKGGGAVRAKTMLPDGEWRDHVVAELAGDDAAKYAGAILDAMVKEAEQYLGVDAAAAAVKA